jgi:hypothetical protein
VGVKVNDFHTLAYVKFKLQITDFRILFVRFHALWHEIHGLGADRNPKKCTRSIISVASKLLSSLLTAQLNFWGSFRLPYGGNSVILLSLFEENRKCTGSTTFTGIHIPAECTSMGYIVFNNYFKNTSQKRKRTLRETRNTHLDRLH